MTDSNYITSMPSIILAILHDSLACNYSMSILCDDRMCKNCGACWELVLPTNLTCGGFSPTVYKLYQHPLSVPPLSLIVVFRSRL